MAQVLRIISSQPASEADLGTLDRWWGTRGNPNHFMNGAAVDYTLDSEFYYYVDVVALDSLDNFTSAQDIALEAYVNGGGIFLEEHPRWFGSTITTPNLDYLNVTITVAASTYGITSTTTAAEMRTAIDPVLRRSGLFLEESGTLERTAIRQVRFDGVLLPTHSGSSSRYWVFGGSTTPPEYEPSMGVVNPTPPTPPRILVIRIPVDLDRPRTLVARAGIPRRVTRIQVRARLARIQVQVLVATYYPRNRVARVEFRNLVTRLLIHNLVTRILVDISHHRELVSRIAVRVPVVRVRTPQVIVRIQVGLVVATYYPRNSVTSIPVRRRIVRIHAQTPVVRVAVRTLVARVTVKGRLRLVFCRTSVGSFTEMAVILSPEGFIVTYYRVLGSVQGFLELMGDEHCFYGGPISIPPTGNCWYIVSPQGIWPAPEQVPFLDDSLVEQYRTPVVPVQELTARWQ